MAHRPYLLAALVLVVVVGLLAGAGPFPASAPTRPPPERPGSRAVGEAATVRPVGVPGRWRVIFRDEFRGQRLDLDRWRPNWLADSDRDITKPVNDAELAAYDPRQVRVTNGSLQLRAVKRQVRDDRGRRYRFASGLVESAHDFRFRYGFAEARIHLRPNTDPALGEVGSCGPNWPAFWLNGRRHPRDGEIDVMECLGDRVAWHYHWAGGVEGGYPSAWSGRMPGGGWHTFGVHWEHGRLRFYYDGRHVGTHRRGVTGAPHYLILNHGISGSQRRLPATLRVDYVRVWKER